MVEYTLKIKVEAVIDVCRELNISYEEIADRISKKFNVTDDYVKNLMMPNEYDSLLAWRSISMKKIPPIP